MEWNMKNNPTFKDISENRSSCFLTVRRHSSFVAKDYYDSKLDKWFKIGNCVCVEEVPVVALSLIHIYPAAYFSINFNSAYGESKVFYFPAYSAYFAGVQRI